MKTLRFIAPALVAAIGVSAASAQVLMFDFGATTASGASLTNSPYHTAAGTGFTDGTWNTVGTADPSSTLKFSDGADAIFGSTPVTLNLGATTTNSTINLGTQPGTSGALGTQTSADIYAGTSVGKDAIFTTTNGTTGVTRVGMQVGGLAAGTYDIYITARNTSTSPTAATYTQTAFAGVSSASGNFNFQEAGNLYASSTLTYSNPNAASSFTGSWVQGSNYIKLSVSITSGDFLNLAIAGGGSENRGFLNSVQIVNTTPVPEPSSFAALAGLGALGLVATRRRRAAR